MRKLPLFKLVIQSISMKITIARYYIQITQTSSCSSNIYIFLFQIYSVWKDHMPIYTISMYMKKNSPLTPFIANGIRKMAETGITNLHTKRHIVSKPNCKPLESKGRTLGLEKFASLLLSTLLVVLFV